jgi:hypothetical protein
MTIKEWLKDVYYDRWGQYLWSKQIVMSLITKKMHNKKAYFHIGLNHVHFINIQVKKYLDGVNLLNMK